MAAIRICHQTGSVRTSLVYFPNGLHSLWMAANVGKERLELFGEGMTSSQGQFSSKPFVVPFPGRQDISLFQ